MASVSFDQFSSNYYSQVEVCINSKQNSYSAEARLSMKELIDQIKRDGFCVLEGDDSLRTPFVGLQGIMEHVLTSMKATKVVTNLLGAIHAPTPATPLCARVDGTNVQNLMDASIWNDPDKRATVRERALTIRGMLSDPGTTFYVIFPQGGLEKRKDKEQEIFQESVKQFPNSLKVWVLKNGQIDPAFVGALYYFTDTNGQEYLFSIKSQQANNPQEKSIWGIWCGPLTHPEVKKREADVSTYLLHQGGPHLHIRKNSN